MTEPDFLYLIGDLFDRISDPLDRFIAAVAMLSQVAAMAEDPVHVLAEAVTVAHRAVKERRE